MKALLSGVFLLALAAGAPAMAADMQLKAPPMMVAPASPWNGFYIGLNAGEGRGTSDFATTLTNCRANDLVCGAGGLVFGVPSNQALGSALGTGTGGRGSGFIGGGQIGYNGQIGWAVFGIEGDFDSFKRTSTLTGTGVATTGDPLSVTSSTTSDWLATIRPRIGVAFGSLLVYGTAGVAFTNVQFNQTMSTTLAGATGNLSISDTKAGPVFGGGIEWAVARNWSVKAEYLHADFKGFPGSYGLVSTAPTGFNNLVLAATGNQHDDIVRAGINWRPWQ
jgi:outer membrane immunogenic protein